VQENFNPYSKLRYLNEWLKKNAATIKILMIAGKKTKERISLSPRKILENIELFNRKCEP
jgi:hypothetical protein